MISKTGNQNRSKIPVVGVDTGDLMFDYSKAARFLGDLLGVEDKANALIAYYESAMQYVDNIISSIPASERVRVYYAEGKEGFNTDPMGLSILYCSNFAAASM